MTVNDSVTITQDVSQNEQKQHGQHTQQSENTTHINHGATPNAYIEEVEDAPCDVSITPHIDLLTGFENMQPAQAEGHGQCL